MAMPMKPRIFIEKTAHRKIMHWVDKAIGEVSGLGKVKVLDTGDFFVTDAYLVEQENTAATTDLDMNACAKLLFETKDVPGELKFWWHSHVNMSCFWSPTDTDTIKELAEPGWFVATVFNKKGEHRSCVAQRKPFKMLVDEVETIFWEAQNEEQKKAWDKEFEEKCKAKVYTPPVVSGNRYPTRRDYMDDYHDGYGYGADDEDYKSRASGTAQKDDEKGAQGGEKAGGAGEAAGGETKVVTRAVTDIVRKPGARVAGIKSAYLQSQINLIERLPTESIPEYVDQFNVFCFGNIEYSKAQYLQKFQVNLWNKEVLDYVIDEFGTEAINYGPAVSN